MLDNMNGLKLFPFYFTFLIICDFYSSKVCASDYDADDTNACGKLDFQCGDSGRCLSRTLFCNTKYDCENKYDEDYCRSYDASCPSNWWQCSDRHRCIPGHWRCNGFNDCTDQSDEVGCVLPRKDELEDSSKRNLIKWFLKRRQNGSTTNKWGHELPRTAVALFLGNKGLFTQGSTTMEEMSYEMSIRLLSDLSLHRGGQIKRKDLATYIHALMVTCIDPRDFHGRDLVSELRQKVESSDNSINPFDILVLCNAGDKMSGKDVERIASTYSNRSRPFWIDNQAMATLALACLYNTSDVVIDERTLAGMEKELKKRQFRNGTVENLKTTALVVQALIATQSYEKDFDLDGAVKFILQNQKEDGSMGSFLESYYILPILSNSSLLDISSEHCKRPPTNEDEALSEFQRRRGRISTQFSVWLGDGTDLKRTWTLKVPLNSTFYDILEIANRLDSRQRIAYYVIDGKPYVSSMIGHQDDIEKGIFWFMYVRPQNSEEDPRLVEDSPVDVNIGANQELILWYKAS